MNEHNNGVAPLSLSNVLLLRDHPGAARTTSLPRDGESVSTYLGIDIGSVSTNLALLDEHGNLLHGIYLRTSGRPIEVVQDGLRDISRIFGDRIVVRGVGTTGSGRELIGELVGADTINDEITAHKTGAIFIHQKLARHCAPYHIPLAPPKRKTSAMWTLSLKSAGKTPNLSPSRMA